jgi:TRAP-type C4-dicarboxylate transport system permease small subunit
MLRIITLKINNVLLAIAGAAMVGMVMLIFGDVFLRYTINSPIPGAYEVTEYLMGILVPFAICRCAQDKGHVAVDFVYERLGRRAQYVLDVITTLVSIVLTILLAWQGYIYIVETYRSKLTSAVLKLPEFYFVIPTAVGMTVFAMILTYQLFELSADTKKVEEGELSEVKKSEVIQG